MANIIVPVIDGQGNKIDQIELEEKVFGEKPNAALIYQTVNAYMANQRRGLAATKTRGEVSGGGRKPWRQKGTGRARVGSTRSPLWRHGGVVFGPHPRDFSYTLPQKIRTLALKSALVAKAQENNLIVLDNLVLEKVSTKEAAKLLSGLPINAGKNTRSKVLLLLDTVKEEARRALRNIDSVRLNLARDTNAYEILASRKVIVTRLAFKELMKRLKE